LDQRAFIAAFTAQIPCWPVPNSTASPSGDDNKLAHDGGKSNLGRLPGEGTCIKHSFGKSSIKMYDKLGTILRIETTTNTLITQDRFWQDVAPQHA
jgi:hypothetical protein